MNLTQLLRQLLVLHQHVRDLQVEALKAGDLDRVKIVRRQEGVARQERHQLCRLIRGEIRLRLDARDHGRAFSQTERANHFARQGTRGK